MTDPHWWRDARMLDAGDVQRLQPPTPTAPGSARGEDVPADPATGDLSGDLDAAAERLGMDVADLVRARRRLGIAASHRRPGRFARLLDRIRRP